MDYSRGRPAGGWSSTSWRRCASRYGSERFWQENPRGRETCSRSGRIWNKARANLQTEIDIIKGDFKFLVESANLVIDLAGSHKAGGGDGGVALNGVVLIMITAILGLDIPNGVEKMTGDTTKPNNNTRMLNGFIPEE